jgi:hypothetical protein
MDTIHKLVHCSRITGILVFFLECRPVSRTLLRIATDFDARYSKDFTRVRLEFIIYYIFVRFFRRKYGNFSFNRTKALWKIPILPAGKTCSPSLGAQRGFGLVLFCVLLIFIHLDSSSSGLVGSSSETAAYPAVQDLRPA